MTWQPNIEQLRQLAQVLKDSVSGQDQETRRNAEALLKQAEQAPDYNNYITFLAISQQQPDSISLREEGYLLARSAAIIELKNNFRKNYRKISEECKIYTRSVILDVLNDPSTQMRNLIGLVITELVKQGGVMAWPDLLFKLFVYIENQSQAYSEKTQEAAIEALLKVSEDNRKLLEKNYPEGQPLAILYTKLLEFLKSSVVAVRAKSLEIINIFLPDRDSTIMSNFDELLRGLSERAFDESAQVRRQVCRSWTCIAEVNPESIIPNLEGIINYTLLQQSQNDFPELALDAAEFWVCASENDILVKNLQPFLPQIIPVLMDCTVYTEDQIVELSGEYDDDDADVEDREQDIKPTFAATKDSRKPTDNLSEGELSGSDDDDDDDEYDPEEDWSRRKSCAAALDILAGIYKREVFVLMLPWLQNNLQNSEWPYREAAVLTLGAVSEGCLAYITPHLPGLFQYLHGSLDDKEPIVRQITCWTLSRYSTWAISLDEAGKEEYFVPIMKGLLGRMLDRNKKVQEAAASAFAALEEGARSQLAPYSQIILQQFVACFDRYKDRNMFILYDCVQTLAEHIGPVLKDPALVDLLMPALINRYNKITDQNREIFALLECLAYVASALNESFEPFAEPVFGRCIGIMSNNLNELMLAQSEAGYDGPDKDFLVTSLDLLSAIIQALPGSSSTALVESANPNMFEMLIYCLKHNSQDVRQSSYALVGDCAVFIFPTLQGYLPQVIPCIIDQLEIPADIDEIDIDDNEFAVINNACWAIGEISMRQLSGMAQWIQPLLQKLYSILTTSRMKERLISLWENSAVAFGRLGLGCPELIAPHINEFAGVFLDGIKIIQWTDEKAHAIIGFVRIALAAETSKLAEKQLMDIFVELANAPAEFLKHSGDNEASQQRYTLFKQLVDRYKDQQGFKQFIEQMPQQYRENFKTTFQL